jgi:hypothetical protein
MSNARQRFAPQHSGVQSANGLYCVWCDTLCWAEHNRIDLVSIYILINQLHTIGYLTVT